MHARSISMGGSTAGEAIASVSRQGNRKLGESICEVDAENQMDKFASGPPALYVTNCRDRDQRIKQTGALKVEVYFINDATDQETRVGTHDLLIRSVKRVRGTGEPDAPHHDVDRHSEALSSFIALQHNRADHPYNRLGRDFSSMSGSNRIVVLVNMSTDESHRSIDSGSHLRCSVDGSRIEIPRDQVTGREARAVCVVQT